MKLSDFVCFDAVIPQLKSSDRDDVIVEMVEALGKSGKLGKAKAEAIAKAVIARENEASTGIGKGVAVPHVKHPDISDVVATIGGCEDGVEFSSLDKKPVYSVILLLSPDDNPDKHLQAMENIFRNLQKDDFRKFLRQAKTVKAIKEAIVDHDADYDS
ncbi:MAG: PTS sugar transporter subunit IIA [Planctomycetes bacterium]|nr:PTS sugar transporter subunit IIA [Planctomycetota bacterium]